MGAPAPNAGVRDSETLYPHTLTLKLWSERTLDFKSLRAEGRVVDPDSACPFDAGKHGAAGVHGVRVLPLAAGVDAVENHCLPCAHVRSPRIRVQAQVHYLRGEDRNADLRSAY